MKLAELQTNIEAVEQGAWVDNIPDMAGLRLKVRGANNKDWRKLTARLIDAVPRKKRMNGRLDPDEQDRINSIVLREAGLIGWDGLENEDNKPLLYSKEMAGKFLDDPALSKFRDAVMWACVMVGEQESVTAETIAKN